MGRGREGPRKFLGNYDGILQTDGYSAYDEVGGAKIIRAGCWSHALVSARGFLRAKNFGENAAIDELFSIEALAREWQGTVELFHELSQFWNRISRRWNISFLMSLISVNWPHRVTSQFLGWPSISTINSSTSPSLSGYFSRRCCLQLSAVCFCRFLVPSPMRFKLIRFQSTI
jgi:Transposase IS66 family